MSTEEARDRDGEAEQIVNFLGVGSGMRVAGLGAGAGYYTIRLARRVQAAWRNGRNAQRHGRALGTQAPGAARRRRNARRGLANLRLFPASSNTLLIELIQGQSWEAPSR